MSLSKALQVIEESIRRPRAMDDSVLLAETDNAIRQVIAELNPLTLAGTLDAIVSQIRHILYGVGPGQWSDVPAITLALLASYAKWKVQEFLISPGATLAIDTNLFLSFKSAKYHLEFSNPAVGERGSFEMLASRNGLSVTDSIYSIVGKRFSANVNFHVVAADANLAVTNNEAYALAVKITKLSD